MDPLQGPGLAPLLQILRQTAQPTGSHSRQGSGRGHNTFREGNSQNSSDADIVHPVQQSDMSSNNTGGANPIQTNSSGKARRPSTSSTLSTSIEAATSFLASNLYIGGASNAASSGTHVPSAAPHPIKAILQDAVPKTNSRQKATSGAPNTNIAPGNKKNGPPAKGQQRSHVEGAAAGATGKSVGLFSHLMQPGSSSLLKSPLASASPAIHPAISRFALRSASYVNLGGSRRCRELLDAVKDAINDYRSIPEMAICRHMDAYLKPMIGLLVEARPLGIAMANAIRAIRHQISLLPVEMGELEAKRTMTSFIDSLIANRLEVADRLIVGHALQKIASGDVILTFARSSVVHDLLLEAWRTHNLQFRVIVADCRPYHEGATLLRELVAAGIPCSYVSFNALAYIMKEVTKTIIGAAGIYANGTLLSRTGTAALCALSRRSNVPVIVCCETIKFSERSQIDSFVFNELGDPQSFVSRTHHHLQFAAADDYLGGASEKSTDPLSNWKSIPALKLLNILYDVTPAEYITVAVTEIGLIPVTSVPVVLREYSATAATGGASTTTTEVRSGIPA